MLFGIELFFVVFKIQNIVALLYLLLENIMEKLFSIRQFYYITRSLFVYFLHIFPKPISLDLYKNLLFL